MLLGCEAPQKVSQSNYFSVDSLIEAQSSLLSSRTRRIQKTVEIDGKQEVSTLDKVDWEKELAIFSGLEINQPRNVGAYQIESTINTTRYVPIPEEKVTVKLLEMLKEESELAMVSGINEDVSASPIYYTKREYKMHFENGELIRYSVNGVQKMALKDSVRFSIIGEIR